MRVNDEFLALVDSWRKAQPIMPTRTEAIRQMVEIAAKRGLAAGEPVSKRGRTK